MRRERGRLGCGEDDGTMEVRKGRKNPNKNFFLN
jgi:hypothetical protein